MSLSSHKPCSCQCQSHNKPPNKNIWWTLLIGHGLFVVLYVLLSPFSQWVTSSLLGLPSDNHLGSALSFFLYEVPKVTLLLTLVIFWIGVLRSFLTPVTMKKLLSGKREGLGLVLAALLGIMTPFCSCAAVPLYMGFLSAGVPLGVTLAFLVAAPMINEVALVLLASLLGIKITLLYVATGLFIAIVSGGIIGRLKLEKYIEPWVFESANSADNTQKINSFTDRLLMGWQAVRSIVIKVLPYIVLGIGVGAGIHGFVPENFLSHIMGKDNWWAVPAVIVMGVPLYSGSAGIIPVVQALLGKGAALGTVLAFMMSVIGLSLPEMIILRKVLKPQLLAIFVGIVATGIMIVGFLFNMMEL